MDTNDEAKLWAIDIFQTIHKTRLSSKALKKLWHGGWTKLFEERNITKNEETGMFDLGNHFNRAAWKKLCKTNKEMKPLVIDNMKKIRSVQPEPFEEWSIDWSNKPYTPPYTEVTSADL